MSILDKLGYGGITAAIGIIIVFAGLAIIIGILYLMAQVFKKIEANKQAKAAAAAPKAEPVQETIEPAEEEEEEEEEEIVNDSQLIAVIAAAIAAFDFGGKPVAIKTVRRMSAWKNAARTEQVYKL